MNPEIASGVQLDVLLAVIRDVFRCSHHALSFDTRAFVQGVCRTLYYGLLLCPPVAWPMQLKLFDEAVGAGEAPKHSVDGTQLPHNLAKLLEDCKTKTTRK